MTRAEKVATATRLRAEGLTYREIGEQLGFAIQTVHGWLSDPDLSRQRARRVRYSQPCIDCGTPTHGGGGYADPCERCSSCWHRYQHETRHWTREAIIAWIKDFAARYGSPPPSSVMAKRRTEFFEAPHTRSVRAEFGPDCWKAALRAAGFEPYRDKPGTGHKLGLDHPTMQETARLYREGWSGPEIAERHDVTPEAVYQRLDHLGVPRRSRAEHYALRGERVAA